MIFIPADFFKNPITAKFLIQRLDLVGKITKNDYSNESFLSKFKEDREKLSMLRSNRKSLELELDDDNIESAMKRFIKTKEIFSSSLEDAITKYKSYQLAGNSLNNRFLDIKKPLIRGVGVDGSGDHPKNYKQEQKEFLAIEEAARKYDLWNIGHEEMLKQSIGNVIFWQSSNFSQFSIGTPSQIVSAMIQLANCDERKGPIFEYRSKILGSVLVTERPECAGIQYLLEGNKYDLEDTSFNGRKVFLDHSFRRFFYSSNPENRSIYFKVGAAKTESNFSESSSGYRISTNTTNLMNENFYKDLIDLLDGNIEEKRKKHAKYGAIMLVYGICFSYISYINNLYKILISNIKNQDLKDKYNMARLESTKSFLNLVNYAINRNFRLKVDDIQDLIVASIDEEDSKNTVKAGPGKSSTKYKMKYTNFDSAISSFGLEDISKNIYIGFKNADYYETILEEDGRVDEDMFTKDKYPIVFTNINPGDKYKGNIIDYVETMKRFVQFLLMDSSSDVPKLKDKTPIAVGAPFQNEDLLEETAEALEGWYKWVISSKTIYLQYMEMKMAIFTSSIPMKNITDIRDYIFNKLRIIGDTIASSTQKEIACVELVNYIISKYRDYRKAELRLVDDKSILVDNKFRVLGEKPDDYPREYARALKRLHYGLEAVLIIEIAKLCYEIYVESNPTHTLCGNFNGELDKRVNEVNKTMGDKLKKIFSRKLVDIETKYGKNALTKTKVMSDLLTLSSAPSAPEEYKMDIMKMIESIGKEVGMTGVTSQQFLKGQKLLKYEQRIRVENDLFWRNLYNSFNSRLIFIPMVKRTGRGNFDDNNFYLVDVFSSMIRKKLHFIPFDANYKDILNKLYQKAYILFTNSTDDLNDPSKWRGLDYNIVIKLLKKGSSTEFKNIALARDAFFNLLANNYFYKESMKVAIPVKSLTSQVVQLFCGKILKKNKLSQCGILVSREQFSKTVQQKLYTFEGSSGIDFTSGLSWSEYTPLINTSNLVKRT